MVTDTPESRHPLRKAALPLKFFKIKASEEQQKEKANDMVQVGKSCTLHNYKYTFNKDLHVNVAIQIMHKAYGSCKLCTMCILDVQCIKCRSLPCIIIIIVSELDSELLKYIYLFTYLFIYSWNDFCFMTDQFRYHTLKAKSIQFLSGCCWLCLTCHRFRHTGLMGESI